MDFQMMRSDPQQRNAFLGRLAADNGSKIRHALHEVRRAIFDVDDAVQAFLIGANAAIDTARTEDDGRGKNDPAAWCAWRGMMAVKAALRNVRGRSDRQTQTETGKRAMYYAEEAPLHYADPNNYADEACANLDLAHLLSKLRGIDREAAMLLLYGRSDTTELVCQCAGQHSYIQDIARAINSSETRVFKILRRIRDAATKEFQAA